eukprot:8188759-Karenia_brevis.AAC.1
MSNISYIEICACCSMAPGRSPHITVKSMTNLSRIVIINLNKMLRSTRKTFGFSMKFSIKKNGIKPLGLLAVPIHLKRGTTQ